VPDLVVVLIEVVVAVIFPGESDFVQKFLSVWSNFVVFMIDPLITNPPPESLVFLVLLWHHTMAIV
jgi:hypothetical protein